MTTKERYSILYLQETPYLGGAEKSIVLLASSLDKARFRTVVACPANDSFGAELRKYAVTVEDVSLPKIRGLTGVKGTLDVLSGLVKKYEIDLIHGNGLRSNIYASLIGKQFRLPVVWHARNLVTKEPVDWERLLWFLPDRILCNGTGIAKRFTSFGVAMKKAAVVYTGIDTALYNPNAQRDNKREELGIKDDEMLFGSIGRLCEGKGHRYFIEAASEIAKEHQKIKFIIVGGPLFPEDSYMEGELKELADKLGVRDRVIFTGFRDDIPRIMNMLDVFVLPSIAEPFGRVLLEAMACAKPVIATNSGGTPEIVVDNVTGILIPPKDAAALKFAMERFIRDRELAGKMGGAALKRARDVFDIRKIIGTVEKIYTELIERARDNSCCKVI